METAIYIFYKRNFETFWILYHSHQSEGPRPFESNPSAKFNHVFPVPIGLAEVVYTLQPNSGCIDHFLNLFKSRKPYIMII